MRFRDIPQFTPAGSYKVNVPIRHVENELDYYLHECNLQMNPDFQRGHVWTTRQQISYVEFLLKGGRSARTIYFNCPSWQGYQPKDSEYNDFVCVDGLQRITAILAFLHNEIPVFGFYYKDYEDKIPFSIDLIFNINDLKTKAEVLRWYIEMNSGGTPHTDEEINRIRSLLEKEDKK